MSRGTLKVTTGVVALTSACRVTPWRRAISPNWSPGCRTVGTPELTMTVACPASITKNLSPCSPWRMMVASFCQRSSVLCSASSRSALGVEMGEQAHTREDLHAIAAAQVSRGAIRVGRRRCGGGRKSRQCCDEVIPRQGEQLHWARGPDGRHAGRAAQERPLAEVTTWDDRPDAEPVNEDVRPPRVDDVEAITGLALSNDVGTLGDPPGAPRVRPGTREPPCRGTPGTGRRGGGRARGRAGQPWRRGCARACGR